MTTKELAVMFQNYGIQVNQKDLLNLFQSIKSKKRDQVDFEEFVRLIKTPKAQQVFQQIMQPIRESNQKFIPLKLQSIIDYISIDAQHEEWKKAVNSNISKHEKELKQMSQQRQICDKRSAFQKAIEAQKPELETSPKSRESGSARGSKRLQPGQFFSPQASQQFASNKVLSTILQLDEEDPEYCVEFKKMFATQLASENQAKQKEKKSKQKQQILDIEESKEDYTQKYTNQIQEFIKRKQAEVKDRLQNKMNEEYFNSDLRQKKNKISFLKQRPLISAQNSPRDLSPLEHNKLFTPTQASNSLSKLNVEHKNNSSQGKTLNTCLNEQDQRINSLKSLENTQHEHLRYLSLPHFDETQITQLSDQKFKKPPIGKAPKINKFSKIRQLSNLKYDQKENQSSNSCRSSNSIKYFNSYQNNLKKEESKTSQESPNQVNSVLNLEIKQNSGRERQEAINQKLIQKKKSNNRRLFSQNSSINYQKAYQNDSKESTKGNIEHSDK